MRSFDDGRNKARRADTVGAHLHFVFLAIRPLHLGTHRCGIFGAEVKDMTDLNAAGR